MTIRLLAALLLLPASLLHAQPAQRFAILITELMPDPSPPVGLPAQEYIELKNVSQRPVNLLGWKLSDGASTANINVAFILEPDSQVVICSHSAASMLSAFGSCIGVSNFPSLNNDADVITLYSPEGATIHAVAYSDQWYQNSVKINGGWSLEMIDAANPCTAAANWKASTHPGGGTPGKDNSVKGINADDMPPIVVSTYAPDSVTLLVLFNESLDSLQAAVPLSLIHI